MGNAQGKVRAFLAPLGKDGFSELLTIITEKVVNALQKAPAFKDWLKDLIRATVAEIFGVENASEIPAKLQGHEEMLTNMGREIDNKVNLAAKAALEQAIKNPDFVWAVSQAINEGKDKAEERRKDDIRSNIAEIRGVGPEHVTDALVQSIYEGRIVFGLPRDSFHDAISAELARRETEMAEALNAMVTKANASSELVQKYARVLVDEVADPTIGDAVAFLREELRDPAAAESAREFVDQMKKAIAKDISADAE
jgi:hypothetical protein